MSRSLSNEFIDDLTVGILSPIANKVREDDTLMLALRGHYINVYYRGGSILRLQRNGGANYKANFDERYNILGTQLPDKPNIIVDLAGAKAWIEAFKDLKEVMNAWFTRHSKSEREFQQLVAWENNRSPLANGTDYFITDIEYTRKLQKARFDMLGIKWLASDRQIGSKCQPVVVEMKYGDGALTGKSGIVEHIKDLECILGNADNCDNLKRTVAGQFEQLAKLGLIRFTPSPRFKHFTFGRPLVAILLANHNPKSKMLLDAIKTLSEPAEFDLRFFVSNLAGYAMYDECMLTLDGIRSHLERRKSNRKATGAP